MQSNISQITNPIPHTTGSRMMHALDVLRVSSPMEVHKARANAMMLADRYGFRLPAPLDGAESTAEFVRHEGGAFVAGMRPVFDAEIRRIAGSGQSHRLYMKEDLVHADIAAASMAGLVSPEAVTDLLAGVVKNSERLLDYAYSRVPENRLFEPKFFAGRLAADISAFGAAFAITGSALAAAAVACALAIKIEASAIAASRLSISRQRRQIKARIAEFACIIERAREQEASLPSAGRSRSPEPEIQVLDEADLVLIE